MKKIPLLLIMLSICTFLSANDSIYAINYFDGLNYNSTIVPPSSETIYLLSNNTHVITAKETNLYYWPLTSEYKADWATKNKTLSGTIVVSSNSKIKTINAQPYVIQYDANNMKDTIKIYWNDDAIEAYSGFLSLQNAYVEALHEYNAAEQKYSKEIDNFFQNRSSEELVFPEPPTPLQPFSLLSTEIHIGYPINLEEGNYIISFIDKEGKSITTLKKKLISFSPISFDKGFKVFEENKWTVPSKFPDSHNTLYTTKGAKLYFEPQLFTQYESKINNLMVNPQDSFYTQDEYYIWKPTGSYNEPYMKLVDSQILVKGYKVVQIAGSKLGYEMREMPVNLIGNSFNAALLDVNTLREGKSHKVGSSSKIVVLRLFSLLPLLMIIVALLPIVGFILISFIKNVQKKRKTNEFYS